MLSPRLLRSLKRLQADKEYEDTMKELRERLSRMTPYKVMEQQAQLTDNMAKVMSGIPLKMTVV